VKSTAGIGTLLAEGIGDTIRYSLTADPVEEARAGRTLLEALGLRERRGLDLIACPSCGRAEVDVIAVANEVMGALESRNIPLQVAVMGCVVNGRGKGHLFVKGHVVRVVPESEMVAALIETAERVMDEGIDAVIASADAGAAEEAAATRVELLRTQGEDANHSEERVARIREIAD
jgi:(E)-4-hydroxy-3-methylbut-2-enyl-diphosphate synthase